MLRDAGQKPKFFGEEEVDYPGDCGKEGLRVYAEPAACRDCDGAERRRRELLRLFSWSADVSSAGQGWWLVPLGAACLAAACGLLHALGRLRARLTQALTDSSQEERVASTIATVLP